MKTKRDKKNGVRKTKKIRIVHGGGDPKPVADLKVSDNTSIIAVQNIVDAGFAISKSAEEEDKRELMRYISEQYDKLKQHNVFVRFVYGANNASEFNTENIQKSVSQIIKILQVVMYGSHVQDSNLKTYKGISDGDIVTIIYFFQRLIVLYKNDELTVDTINAELHDLALPEKTPGNNIYPAVLADNAIRNIIRIIRAVLIINASGIYLPATNNILQDKTTLNKVMDGIPLTNLDDLISKILCFLDLIARVKNTEERKELIFHLLDDIQLLAAPSIVNLFTVATGSTSQDIKCALAGDEKINMDKLKNMSKNYPFTKSQTTLERTPGLDTALKHAIDEKEELKETHKKHSGPIKSAFKGFLNTLGLRGDRSPKKT